MSPKKRQRDPLCTWCRNKISSCKAVRGCGQIWEVVGNTTDSENIWGHTRCGEQHVQKRYWANNPRVKACCAGQCFERCPDGEVGGRRDGSEMAQCCAAPLNFLYVCQVAEEAAQQAGDEPATVTDTTR